MRVEDVPPELAKLALSKPEARQYFVDNAAGRILRGLKEPWDNWWHEGQEAPGGDWRVWLMMAGRGFGKTKAGAEWVSSLARADGKLRIALVGATLQDVAKVMVEGKSGLMRTAQFDEDVIWVPSRGTLTFSSGAMAFAYSGDR